MRPCAAAPLVIRRHPARGGSSRHHRRGKLPGLRGGRSGPELMRYAQAGGAVRRRFHRRGRHLRRLRHRPFEVNAAGVTDHAGAVIIATGPDQLARHTERAAPDRATGYPPAPRARLLLPRERGRRRWGWGLRDGGGARPHQFATRVTIIHRRDHFRASKNHGGARLRHAKIQVSEHRDR